MLPKKLTRETLEARKRYNRWAGVFDFLEQFFEILAFRRWRKELLVYARGSICEMGIGTGRNMDFYPSGSQVTGFDISNGMLHRLRRKYLSPRSAFDPRSKSRSVSHRRRINLAVMDAQRMALRDSFFDTMLATFIFCTVPEPVLALKEALRACKPGGTLLLLEHVRMNTPIAGRIMDFLNPAVRFLMGDNINRITADNVKKAGWLLKEVRNLGGGMVNLIIAEKEGALDAG